MHKSVELQLRGLMTFQTQKSRDITIECIFVAKADIVSVNIVYLSHTNVNFHR